MRPFHAIGFVLVLCGCATASDFASNSGAEVSTAAGPVGATVGTSGVTFRVWAPSATAAFVRGDFTGWDDPGLKMKSEAGGYYAVTIASARAGDGYEFVLDSSAGRVHRIDPRAKQVVEDKGGFERGVVVDPNAYTWTTTGF